MKRMVVGVLGLGVAGALAASGAAVAHMVNAAHRTTEHSAAVTARQNAAAKRDDTGSAMRSDTSGMPSGGSAETGAHLRVYLKTLQGDRDAQVDILALEHGGNLVTISAWNLKPGYHAIQLDTVGSCDPNTGFASAGQVLHAFPVLAVGGNGRARAQFVDGNFKIKDLAGPTGSSIVIHSVFASGTSPSDARGMLADDNRPRISCGVVFRTKTPGTGSPTPTPTPTMPGQPTPSPTATVPGRPTPSQSTQAGHHW